MLRALAVITLLTALLGTFAPTATAVPANDDFPGTPLAVPATVVGTTEDATTAAPDGTALPTEGPGERNTVWYSFVAGSTQWLTVDTCDSDLDTIVAVVTGDAASPVGIGSFPWSDDSALCGEDATGSSLTWQATAGTTYWIVVDGYESDTGDFTLRLRPDTDAPETNWVVSDDQGMGLGGVTRSTSARIHSLQAQEHGAYNGPADQRFECSLDGSPFAGCAAPILFTGLALGPHTLSARSVDVAGNADLTPATTTWTVLGPVPAPAAAGTSPLVPLPPPRTVSPAPKVAVTATQRLGRGTTIARIRVTAPTAGILTVNGSILLSARRSVALKQVRQTVQPNQTLALSLRLRRSRDLKSLRMSLRKKRRLIVRIRTGFTVRAGLVPTTVSSRVTLKP